MNTTNKRLRDFQFISTDAALYAPLRASLNSPLIAPIEQQKITPKLDLQKDLYNLFRSIPAVKPEFEIIFHLPTLFLKDGKPIAARLNSYWLWGSADNLPYAMDWPNGIRPGLKKTGTIRPNEFRDCELLCESITDLEQNPVFAAIRDRGKAAALTNLNKLMKKLEKEGNFEDADIFNFFPETEAERSNRTSEIARRALLEWRAIYKQWEGLEKNGKNTPWGSLKRVMPPDSVTIDRYDRPYPIIHFKPYRLESIEGVVNLIKRRGELSDFNFSFGSCQFGYYVEGSAERISNDKVKVVINAIGYRINDNYDFRSYQNLFYWSLQGFEGLIPSPKKDIVNLTNSNFQEFRRFAIDTLNPKLKDYSPQFELKCNDFAVITDVTELNKEGLEKKIWEFSIKSKNN